MPPNRGKRMSEAEFRRLWFDRRISCVEIGAQLGITQSAVYYRAKSRGLPDRRREVPTAKFSHPEFTAMWLAGVLRTDMAAHFGMCERMVTHYVTRLGLPKRAGGHSSITIASFAEQRLAERIAATAAADRKAVADHWRRAA